VDEALRQVASLLSFVYKYTSCTSDALSIKIGEIVRGGEIMSSTIPFKFHPAFIENIGDI
jgi:hypothetical protein